MLSASRPCGRIRALTMRLRSGRAVPNSKCKELGSGRADIDRGAMRIALAGQLQAFKPKVIVHSSRLSAWEALEPWQAYAVWVSFAGRPAQPFEIREPWSDRIFQPCRSLLMDASFCDGTGLTKSHVWPEWADAILPKNTTHHEHTSGQFHTFVPKRAGVPFSRRVRQGGVETRKPRNTCLKCNAGWMRRIEEATMPFMAPLLLGQQHLLDTFSQRLLATFLCLVSMRVRLSTEMRANPQTDRDWLRFKFEPPPNWQIWIAQYEGKSRMDELYSGIQVSLTPAMPISPNPYNTQVTTLVVGRLCAHLYSSTVWTTFAGYSGGDLRAIGPSVSLILRSATCPSLRRKRSVAARNHCAGEADPRLVYLSRRFASPVG